MRPDKKKTRHHDSRKREAIAKEKIAKSKNPHDTGRKGAETAQAAEVGPTGDDDGRYSKRNICSNWTKYEVSSEDEESGSDDVGHSMTGEDFNYVLQNAATSDSLFRLKSERLWEEDKQIFANELFALDLKDLEAAIGTLPLQQQVDFAKEDLNPDDVCGRSLLPLMGAFERKAAQRRQAYQQSKAAVVPMEKEVGEIILQKLSLHERKDQEKPTRQSSEGPTDNEVEKAAKDTLKAEEEDLEEWLDDFLDD